MLNAKLEVVSVGTPDITKLPESEQRIFFETLYARVAQPLQNRMESIAI